MLELQHHLVPERVIAMIETEICENALGHQSRYVKGLCFCPNRILLSNIDKHLLNAG